MRTKCKLLLSVAGLLVCLVITGCAGPMNQDTQDMATPRPETAAETLTAQSEPKRSADESRRTEQPNPSWQVITRLSGTARPKESELPRAAKAQASDSFSIEGASQRITYRVTRTGPNPYFNVILVFDSTYAVFSEDAGVGETQLKLSLDPGEYTLHTRARSCEWEIVLEAQE